MALKIPILEYREDYTELRAQVHTSGGWVGLELRWDLSTAHAFYSPKTETVPSPLIIRSLVTSEATATMERQEMILLLVRG